MPLEHIWAFEEHRPPPLLVTQCYVSCFSPVKSAQVTWGYCFYQHTTGYSTCCRTGLPSSLLSSSLRLCNTSPVQPKQSWAKVLITSLSPLSCLLPGPVPCKAANCAPPCLRITSHYPYSRTSWWRAAVKLPRPIVDPTFHQLDQPKCGLTMGEHDISQIWDLEKYETKAHNSSPWIQPRHKRRESYIRRSVKHAEIITPS